MLLLVKSNTVSKNNPDWTCDVWELKVNGERCLFELSPNLPLELAAQEVFETYNILPNRPDKRFFQQSLY